MAPKTTTRPRNGYDTRLAMLEQNNADSKFKLDRLYAYVFGSDVAGEESMKSQMKNLTEKVEQVMKSQEELKQELGATRTEGTNRLENLEDRVERLEDWKKEQAHASDDRKGLSRQYTFLIVSIVASSIFGDVIGRILERLFTP